MSIVDEYDNDIFAVFGKLVSAARDVVKSDGTDRLSIEQLREALYAYNAWIGENEA